MIKSKHEIAKENLEAAMAELARLDTYYETKELAAQRVKDEAETHAKKIVEDAQKAAQRLVDETKRVKNMLAGLST